MEPPLRVAAARIEELERQAEQLAAGARAIEKRRADLGEPPPPPPVVNLDGYRQEAVLAETDHRNAIRQVAGAEAALTNAREAAARRAALEEKIGAASAHHGDWVLLSRELGKDGLQATLIDAALPELQALTNSLLHQNFGPRFTVEVRSQAADSKGKRLLETLDVMVLDGESGREAPVETYSGGERAIIGEGLSLALTTLASRESGLTGATLIRDEAGAALDPANGRAWIAMLRQAARVMGADRLLFVSHSKELADLADSRIDL
jgi:exonuclease SbcC